MTLKQTGGVFNTVHDIFMNFKLLFCANGRRFSSSVWIQNGLHYSIRAVCEMVTKLFACSWTWMRVLVSRKKPQKVRQGRYLLPFTFTLWLWFYLLFAFIRLLLQRMFVRRSLITSGVHPFNQCGRQWASFAFSYTLSHIKKSCSIAVPISSRAMAGKYRQTLNWFWYWRKMLILSHD